MEVMKKGQNIANSTTCNENLTKFYFENQKWFKDKARNLDNIAFLQREVFISILNHDLKIPTLAQIRALELLLDESEGHINKSQKEIIDLTLTSCRYMYEMLSTLLSAYKYENNDIILYFENTDLLRLVEACCAKSKKDLENKNIRVVISSKENLPGIPADKLQVKKAFENIIDYAISSANENTDIICDFKKCDGKISISITFESPYVSSEKLNNMFNMYTSPAENLDKVGSALRLYLAKQIIEAHNGNVFIQDNQTTGCIIELPCINKC